MVLTMLLGPSLNAPAMSIGGMKDERRQPMIQVTIVSTIRLVLHAVSSGTASRIMELSDSPVRSVSSHLPEVVAQGARHKDIYNRCDPKRCRDKPRELRLELQQGGSLQYHDKCGDGEGAPRKGQDPAYEGDRPSS